jgi:hypothetical protein
VAGVFEKTLLPGENTTLLILINIQVLPCYQKYSNQGGGFDIWFKGIIC